MHQRGNINESQKNLLQNDIASDGRNKVEKKFFPRSRTNRRNSEFCVVIIIFVVIMMLKRKSQERVERTEGTNDVKRKVR